VTGGRGTAEDPWALKTPPGSSEYTMYRDDAIDPPALVLRVKGILAEREAKLEQADVAKRGESMRRAASRAACSRKARSSDSNRRPPVKPPTRSTNRGPSAVGSGTSVATGVRSVAPSSSGTHHALAAFIAVAAIAAVHASTASTVSQWGRSCASVAP